MKRFKTDAETRRNQYELLVDRHIRIINTTDDQITQLESMMVLMGVLNTSEEVFAVEDQEQRGIVMVGKIITLLAADLAGKEGA